MSDLLQRVDHLVYGTTELERGIDEVEQLLGVRATRGGRHPGKGTRNALLSLGPRVYLEIIGPDPDQPPPPQPRTFGIDALTESRLVTWAVNSDRLEDLRARALASGAAVGEVKPASRERPDGVLLTWHYTDPTAMPADGIVPFFIDWGDSPHPAAGAPAGALLVGLRAEHPDPGSVQRMLRPLGVPLDVSMGREPALIAVIDTQRGLIELR